MPRRMIYVDTLPWGDYDVQVEYPLPACPIAKAAIFSTIVEGLCWAAKELNLPYRIGTAHPASMEIEIGYASHPD